MEAMSSKELRVTTDLRDAAGRVGERLQGEFRTMISGFPLDARTIGGMSRWLGVTKPVCQRLLRGTRHPGDPLAALTYFPGVRGLRQVVQAVRDRGGDPSIVAAASAAVDRYEVLIHEQGGSQTRLLTALEELRKQPGARGRVDTLDPDPMLEARRRAFESLRLVTGREFHAQVAVFAYRPTAGDPDRLDCMTAMGMIGIRRMAHSLPICPMNRFAFSTQDEREGLDFRLERLGGEQVAAGAPVSVLGEFCSKPLPAVVAREQHGQLSVLIDPDSATTDPFDVVLGTFFPGVRHPALGEVKMQDCSLVSEGPSRHLVMSVFLHRSLAQASIPALDCYALGNRGPISSPDAGAHGPSPTNLAAQRWFDRLPDRPVLEHLGVGLEQVDTAAYPQMTRLVSRLLDAQGWDPNEFVGHRCQVDYPVWGVQYLMSFDFRDCSEE